MQELGEREDLDFEVEKLAATLLRGGRWKMAQVNLVKSDKKWHLQALTYFFTMVKHQVKHSLANMNEVISRGGGERRSKRGASSPLGVVGITWLSIFFIDFVIKHYFVVVKLIKLPTCSRWVIYSIGRSE